MLVTVGGVPESPAAGVCVAPGGSNDCLFTPNATGGSQEIRIVFGSAKG
jgi:hypothetical protein